MLGLKQTEGSFQAKGTAQDSTKAENALWQCASLPPQLQNRLPGREEWGWEWKVRTGIQKATECVQAQEWPEYKAENPFPKKLGTLEYFHIPNEI